MSDEKSKKALKLKTLDEIQHEKAHEIHLFPRTRRTLMRFCVPIGTWSQVSEDGDDDDDVGPDLGDQVWNQRFYILQLSIVVFTRTRI